MSLGSLGCALGIVGFVRCRAAHWCTPWSSGSFAVSGFIGKRPGGSFGVAGFIGVRPGGRRVRFGVAAFIVLRPGCRKVRSRSLGSLGCALVFVGLVGGSRVHWGSPWGSSGSFGVARVHPGGHRDRSGSLGCLVCALGIVGFGHGGGVRSGWLGLLGCPGGRRFRSESLGSLGCVLGDVGFVRCRWVHCCAPWGSSGSFGIAGYIGVRPRVRWG